ncbi:ABC transporter substrate-binding protein [uncultured Martelella sp.]|uniref:ABC transporter substrate-binding protein n=1 Tax=uncultured Martelella sp. TaxID=392331 RepID=UPI0029C73FB4|nr:ABC transporter substrate-binding protein [uncultured Martelella sp.]
MKLTRRTFCGALLVGGVAASRTGWANGPHTVVDMIGRRVDLPAAPKRIVLLEARDIVTMAMLVDDPAGRVVGWAAVDRIDSPVLQAELTGGHEIAVVGKQGPDTVSLEGIVGLEPDLVVSNFYMTPLGEDDLLVRRLRDLGIPVIFSDLATNAAPGDAARPGPQETLEAQMRMWGDVLDAAARADDYMAFYHRHLNRVRDCLKDAAPVTTYLEIQSTVSDCCWAAGTTVWGELLALAGGETLPGVTEAWYQKLQLEHLLSTPFDVYIASGGGWAAGGRPAIGPGLDAQEGREGLTRLIGRTGFSGLDAVRENRVYGIWTGLIASPPLNILFIECAAKWQHPALCAAIDPGETLAEINKRFMSTPIDGPLWVGLEG